MIGPGRGLIHKVEICHLYTNRANVVFSHNYTGVDCCGLLGTWHRANSGDVYLQIFNLCLRPLHIVLGPVHQGPHNIKYCVSPHQECDVVWYAVLRWRCREPGGCCPHGPWAGHVPTVEQVTTLQRVTGECCPYLGDYCAKVDMIITGRGSKICSNCTARCGTKVGKIGLDILYIRCKNTKRCCAVYVSSILLWLETSKVLNLVFCGSSIPFQYRINREYYSGWETHCHLVYGFEFLLSAKSFLSLLNQRKIKMTVIFVVPNTQCFSMTRDDIWWVGMSTEAHKLKLI